MTSLMIQTAVFGVTWFAISGDVQQSLTSGFVCGLLAVLGMFIERKTRI